MTWCAGCRLEAATHAVTVPMPYWQPPLAAVQYPTNLLCRGCAVEVWFFWQESASTREPRVTVLSRP